MMSMSGGWFFVVASEAITVGNTTLMLPGIGSWLALAIAGPRHQRGADGRRHHGRRSSWPTTSSSSGPIVAWADKFRFEQTAARSAGRGRGSTISGVAAGCVRTRRPRLSARCRRTGSRADDAPLYPPAGAAAVRRLPVAHRRSDLDRGCAGAAAVGLRVLAHRAVRRATLGLADVRIAAVVDGLLTLTARRWC